MFNQPLSQIIFYGPRALPNIDNPDDWCIRPLPDHTGCTVIFGLAIPANAPEPERALELLRRLYRTPSRLAELAGCAPAPRKALQLWCARHRIDGIDAFRRDGDIHLLAGRCGFERWQLPVYALLREAVGGRIEPRAAYTEIIRLLHEHRIHCNEYGYFL